MNSIKNVDGSFSDSLFKRKGSAFIFEFELPLLKLPSTKFFRNAMHFNRFVFPEAFPP